MNKSFIIFCRACLFFSVLFWPLPSKAAIEMVATGSVSGEAKDTSGLTGLLEDGTPKDRMGAFGSSLAYTGVGNHYLGLPDRGPSDGKSNYPIRFYEFDIAIEGPHIKIILKRTQLLKNESGDLFLGSLAAFDAINPAKSLRLDPEGIRMGWGGTIFVSDEYGPYLYEFDRKTGKLIRSIKIPQKFFIDHPNFSSDAELPPNNKSGRQANRGMEGLAISPDGRKLFGIMQSPLIQDHGLDQQNKRIGLNVRLLEMSLRTGRTKEYLYPLDNKGNGINEILAVNDHEFLAIERDSKAGREARSKKIYKIDTNGATDISQIPALPENTIPAGVIPVTKQLFIDLLAPRYGLAGENLLEKFEGLTFGPDLKDGRHLLLVSIDNDLMSSRPSVLYAFAIDRQDLQGYQAQRFCDIRTFILLMIGILLFLIGLGVSLKEKKVRGPIQRSRLPRSRQ